MARLSSTLSRKLAPRSSELGGWVPRRTPVPHMKEEEFLDQTWGDDSTGSTTWLLRCTSWPQPYSGHCACPGRYLSLTLPRFWLRLRRCTSLSLAACNLSRFHLYESRGSDRFLILSSGSLRKCCYACLPSISHPVFRLQLLPFNIHSALPPVLPTVRLLAMALHFPHRNDDVPAPPPVCVPTCTLSTIV